MRTSAPEEATCDICGRYFDPSQTRGWCPNPACGQWRHPFFQDDTNGDDQGTDPTPTEPTNSCPNCGSEVPTDARFCATCGNALDEETPQPPAPNDTASDALPCPDCGFDLSDIPPDKLARCPICGLPLPDDFADTQRDPAPTDDEYTACPNCGEDLTPIPPDMRTVCPGCRFDLAADPQQTDTTLEPPSKPTQVDTPADDPRAAAIDTVDAIEPGFDTRLETAGITTVGDLIDANPEALADTTGIAPQRIEAWIDAARNTVEPDQPDPPDELVFEVLGREISVTDGQTVGSEIRSAMVDAGEPKEKAVYVHRKHIRVDAEDRQFYLTRLGENALDVNGNPVAKGDRVPLTNGDELTFSDVVTATVSIR